MVRRRSLRIDTWLLAPTPRRLVDMSKPPQPAAQVLVAASASRTSPAAARATSIRHPQSVVEILSCLGETAPAIQVSRIQLA